MKKRLRGMLKMNSNTSNVSFRIDTDVKNQADRLFSELGLNMTTAFNIFLRQSIRERSLPFNVTINTPNAETIAALLEAEQIGRDPSVKRYSDVEEALRELKS
jgi:DNA-damage-inducible protein J